MSEETLKPQENDKLSSALGEILSNPQMLSTIASMAQSLKAGSQASASPNSTSESEASDTEGTAPTALPSGLTELLGSISSAGEKHNRHNELLYALKPYLSQNRADAIDKIIRFSELSNLFKGLT